MIDSKDKGPKIVCQYCKDSDEFCITCRDTKEIYEYDYIGELMLQAMHQDSVNIRQKILWTFVHYSIEGSVALLKNNMNKELKTFNIECEDYNNLLKIIKKFEEWSEIFIRESELIHALRNINNKDHELYGSWIVRGNIEYIKG